jgi:hypothetical protein
MGMGAIAAPILSGKLDSWRAWCDELNGARKDDFRKFNARQGITRHRAWLAATPDGGHVVIAVTEGPGADGMMNELAKSTDEFDVWFRDQIADIHGVDFQAPPPPMPELLLDVGQ